MSPAVMKKQDINLAFMAASRHREEKCRAYLEESRWPGKVTCPRCGAGSISRIRKRGQYDCNICRYQFSVTSGTVLHNSHLPLWKWFVAAYLMIESENGISANQVRRTIGVSYKTAWYLCHRIRTAMAETREDSPAKGIGGSYRGSETVVIYAPQRRGKPVLQVLDGGVRKTPRQFLSENAVADTEVIWGLLRRSVISSYRKLSTKHLGAYLDETEWRQNNRKNPSLFRDTMLKLIKADNLPYQTLVQ